jgi:hypothetical protein
MIKAAIFLSVLAGPMVMVRPAKGQPFVPKHISDATQICVERIENDGIINIRPVTVTITDSSQVTLLGGQAGCLFIYPGDQSISLTYSYPYGDPKNPHFWTTAKQYFIAKRGEIVSFTLCEAADQQVDNPDWAREGWHKMWLLKRDGVNSAQQMCGPLEHSEP